jgi:hypothetical protein
MGAGADGSAGSAQGLDSAEEGRAAATWRGNRGVDGGELRLGSELQSHANQLGNLKRMAECRGGGLGEGGTERAARVHRAAGIDADSCLIGAGKMAELVNDGTLLRSQQQQEETEYFVHVSHGCNITGQSGLTAKS